MLKYEQICLNYSWTELWCVWSWFFFVSFLLPCFNSMLSHNTCSVVHLFADELVHEKEKYKFICDDLDMTFTELIGN